MTEIGKYDPDTGMFVEEPRPLNLNRLGFLRWLIERGYLEHAIAGPPCGELVVDRKYVDALGGPPEYSGKA